MQELWFLHSACCPIKLNIRMKFHEDILNVYQVRERTRFCDGRAAMAKTMSPHPVVGGGRGTHKNPNKVMCYAYY